MTKLVTIRKKVSLVSLCNVGVSNKLGKETIFFPCHFGIDLSDYFIRIAFIELEDKCG